MPTANNWIEGSSGNSIIYGSGGKDTGVGTTNMQLSGNDGIEAANDFEWRMQA
jgi:hypothetical protein